VDIQLPIRDKRNIPPMSPKIGALTYASGESMTWQAKLTGREWTVLRRGRRVHGACRHEAAQGTKLTIAELTPRSAAGGVGIVRRVCSHSLLFGCRHDCGVSAPESRTVGRRSVEPNPSQAIAMIVWNFASAFH
jgi:hypothetical protein